MCVIYSCRVPETGVCAPGRNLSVCVCNSCRVPETGVCAPGCNLFVFVTVVESQRLVSVPLDVICVCLYQL